MRVNTNVSALNAWRNLTMTDTNLSKSMERLSSGLRINRAADDAAGLAISEKMRGQVRGLNQAVRNAQDGISLIQTAEGSLNEAHAILQRMRELAVQAASDSLTASDRMEIQEEVDQLRTELDRIANTTEFNTKKLLDGTASALTSTDKLSTRVFMRDGLRVEDQFGQKTAGGGNYKIDIATTPGASQVQKTDIMKAKHEAGAELYYETVHQDDEDDDNALHFASLDADVEIVFTEEDTNLQVNVSENTITIDLDSTVGESDTYQEILDAIASHAQASEMVQAYYGGDVTTEIDLSDLEGFEEDDTAVSFELQDPLLTAEEPEFQTVIADGLQAHAIYDDVTINIHDAGVLDEANDPNVEFDAENNVIDVYVQVGEGGTTAQNVYDALITAGEDGEGAAITELLNFYLEEGTQDIEETDVGTHELEGLGNYVGIGDVAEMNTSISDIDRFWDSSGNFLVEDPQTITLVQGDGSRVSFTIFGTDTIEDIQGKLNEAIADGLGQGELVNAEGAEFASYVDEPTDLGDTSVEGTFVIRSAVAGADGEISFIGDEDLIKALSLTTIQESVENQFNIDVADAHTGEVVAEDVNISGNLLVGVVHENVDVRFDSNTGIEVDWDSETNQFTHTGGAENADETFVHLADSTMVFQIGANPLQDVGAAIGDMRAEALGVHNVLVTNQEAANRSISLIDGAVERVSGERSKLGAMQNRLDHTINNLMVAAENLSAAESRIRDVDMASEMMDFTKEQILLQAGTAMLAQANMRPQTVLQLLG